jgi:signal transduction histidine kinase
MAPLSGEDAVESLKLNDFLQTSLRRQWQHSQYKPIRLELRLENGLDDHVTVRASKEWLRHFFKLLVDNAVYAMLNADLPEKRFSVVTRLIEGSAEILIQDTGPGIPKPIRRRVFEERIDKPVGSRGAGVGLVLARTIIETYDGSVRLLSTDETGTTIRVTLPIEKKQQELSLID